MTGDRTVRVLLVEDDPTVQQVVTMLLDLEPDLELVATTPSAEEGIRLVQEHAPHLVLLDNQLEGRLTGLQAAPAIKRAAPSVVVLLCTALDLDEQVRQDDAVDGYLRKERLVDLVEVVRGLLAGRA